MSKNPILTSFLLLGCAAFYNPTPAHATLNIQVLNTTIANGGNGFMDVVISGDNDLLQTFDFEFTISPQGVVTSSLRFIAVQPDPQLNDPLFAPNYVFSGDSFNVNAVFPMGTVNLAQDVFTGSDSTDSLNNFTVNAQRLLVRFKLEHVVPFVSVHCPALLCSGRGLIWRVGFDSGG